jgi:hypothetical protein
LNPARRRTHHLKRRALGVRRKSRRRLG